MNDLSLQLFKNSQLLNILLISLVLSVICAFIFRLINLKKPRSIRRETFYVTLIILVYSVISFTRLGSTKFPVTTWQPTSTPQQIVLELTDETVFRDIAYIYGEGDTNSNPNAYQIGVNGITVDGSNDGESWEELATLDGDNIYRYYYKSGDWNYKFVRITVPDLNDTLTEFALLGNNGKPVPVKIHSDDGADTKYPGQLIIDEQDIVPFDGGQYEDAYFDEIYHVRNAWEIANGQYLDFTVHPLLGTEFIALSIKLFGMHPLAWRLPGALFGIGILILFYHFITLLMGSRKTAVYGTFLLACDFMHLTTSRIGTLEPMNIFFILLMYYFMIKYAKTSFYTVPFRKTLFLLFLSGLSMALAISVKWNSCYSAVGLAIILFYTMISRWNEYTSWKEKQKDNLNNNTDNGEDASVEIKNNVQIARFSEYLIKTGLWCVVFFIFIPVIVYFIVYMPTRLTRDGYSAGAVINQVAYIFNYHTTLNATHPFQSKWYEWVLDMRPMIYFCQVTLKGTYRTISCFSNPMLCLAGIPTILYTIWLGIKKMNFVAFCIAVGYLTALVPWMLVDRCIFVYHFYPTSLFMIMSIAFVTQYSTTHWPVFKNIWITFAVVVLFIFILYMPITCGFESTKKFIQAMEFLKRWEFAVL